MEQCCKTLIFFRQTTLHPSVSTNFYRINSIRLWFLPIHVIFVHQRSESLLHCTRHRFLELGSPQFTVNLLYFYRPFYHLRCAECPVASVLATRLLVSEANFSLLYRYSVNLLSIFSSLRRYSVYISSSWFRIDSRLLEHIYPNAV